MATTFTKTIVTKITQVQFIPWTEANALTTSDSNVYLLADIVGDTVEITTEDTETSDIASETRDEPLYSTKTLGKKTVSFESGSISGDILEAVLGYTKDGDNNYIAPNVYQEKYAAIVVVTQNARIVMPRVLCSGRLDIASMKSDIARITFSGEAFSCDVKAKSGESSVKQTNQFVQFRSDGGSGSFPAMPTIQKLGTIESTLRGRSVNAQGSSGASSMNHPGEEGSSSGKKVIE